MAGVDAAPAGVSYIGYAVRWESRRRRRHHVDVYARGAFRLARRPEVRCTLAGQVVGCTQDGSLTLVENGFGLLVELQPWGPAPALQELLRHGARMVLGARVLEVGWTAPPRRQRVIVEASLHTIRIIPGAAGGRGVLEPKTAAAAWHAQEVDLEARTRAIDAELEDLEAAW